MPIIANAKKALRRDQRRTTFNKNTKLKLKKALRTFHSKPDGVTLAGAYQAVDRATKKRLLPQNKAARLKSQLSKLVSVPIQNKPQKSATPKSKKTASAK